MKRKFKCSCHYSEKVWSQMKGALNREVSAEGEYYISSTPKTYKRCVHFAWKGYYYISGYYFNASETRLPKNESEFTPQ